MKSQYIAAIFLTASAYAAGEEQLSKEITVEREIVPEVRAASRLNLYPRAIPYKPQGKSLNLSEPENTVPVPATITTLEPAATEPAVEPAPWRGYVNAGYFPAANAALSAGYAIVADEMTGLNAWLQLNNTSYKGRPAAGLSKETFNRLAGHVGVDFSHRFNDAGRLEVATGFGFSSFGQPWSIIEKSAGENRQIENQGVIDWALSAMWRGEAGNNLRYHIGAGFDVFNFSKGLPAEDFDYLSATYEMQDGAGAVADPIPAVHQTGFNADLGIAQQINAGSSAGVDLTADFLSYNHFAGESGKTLGVAALKPYYRFGNSVVTLKAGLRLDLTINSGKAFHVAPDVLLGVNPTSGFGAWLRLGGGEELNSLRNLFAFSPYISQIYAYGTSNMPITGDLGLRFGPVKGASLTLGVAYAAANDWLLPEMYGSQLVFGRNNLRAWKASAKLHWEFRKMLSLDASFESRLGSGEKDVWVQWRDRARHRLAASVAFRPIDKLTFDVSYELRMKRSMPVWGGSLWTAQDAAEEGMPVSAGLKDVSDLGVGASYRVTDAFTVFARVDNLLNTETYMLPLVPEQGFSGLAGVTFKF